VELLLTNGQKIVINVARIKPYFSKHLSSRDVFSTNGSDNGPSNELTNDALNSSTLFGLPMLTPTHMHKPGRPCVHAPVEKVLLPSDISFSKLGKDIDLGATSVMKNETKATQHLIRPVNPLRTHHMRMHVQSENEVTISSLVQANYHA
jgi:hypothetical protein